MTFDKDRAPSRGRVDLDGVAKSYGGTPALHGVTLKAEPGEFISLLGPSGCGKTTLLRCIAGLVDVDGGDIRIDGRSLLGIAPWKRDISVVFQSYALFPHMNVAENIGFGLKMRRVDRATAARRVEAALDLVQMSAFASRRPAQLSGGQQQRVALARAIIVEPTILLLDEPMAALDAKLRASVQMEIRSLQQRLGVTTILVTHDQNEAMAMSDRIAVMNDGRIEQIGSPSALYERPATPFVADFIGDANWLHGACVMDGGRKVFRWQDFAIPLPTDADLAPGPSTLVLRPQNLLLAEPDGDVSGTPAGIVESVILSGDRYAAIVNVKGVRLRATILNQSGHRDPPAPGQRVKLTWNPEAVVAFPGHVAR